MSLALCVGRYFAIRGNVVATTRPRRALLGEVQTLRYACVSDPIDGQWPARRLAAAATLVMRADAWITDALWQDDRSDTLSPRHALGAALTGGGAAALGGVLGLVPYLWPLPVATATLLSMMAIILTLAVCGGLMAHLTGASATHSALRAVVAGSLLALVVWALCVSVRLIGSLDT